MGEYDATGSVKKAYAWMPNNTWGTAPLLMVENGQTYYYHNDHLGTPMKLTDESGAIVWSATYAAFGEAVVSPSSTVTNNLRFPGQYFDAETGLHYNYHRYYNPKTGRYTQKDPIGFNGGDTNLYSYVGQNPVRWVDAWGLYDCKRDFFNVLSGPVTKVAKEYKFDPNFLLALSAHESGWLGPHAYELHNAFGLTKGGGNNMEFKSFDDSVEYWAAKYGSKVRGATTINEFISKLQTDLRSQGGSGKYNTIDANYTIEITDSYKSVIKRRGNPCEN